MVLYGEHYELNNRKVDQIILLVFLLFVFRCEQEHFDNTLFHLAPFNNEFSLLQCPLCLDTFLNPCIGASRLVQEPPLLVVAGPGTQHQSWRIDVRLIAGH